MSVNILIVAATEAEADTLRKISDIGISESVFSLGKCRIRLLVTGVGSVATSWALTKWLAANEKPDLAINIGIAGSYCDDINIGDVVYPVSDCFADAGVENADNFLTLSETGLTGADEFPFHKGHLEADTSYSVQIKSILKPVRAITVNTATGSEITREKLVKKFNPDIETMEGATFFYICAREKIPFLALRSISNKVEPRDKSKWNIAIALKNLSEKLNEVIITLD